MSKQAASAAAVGVGTHCKICNKLMAKQRRRFKDYWDTIVGFIEPKEKTVDLCGRDICLEKIKAVEMAQIE